MTYSERDRSDALLDEALALVVRAHSGDEVAPSMADLELWAERSPIHAGAMAEALGLWSDTGALRPMRQPSRGQLSRRVVMFGGLGLMGAGGWAWQETRVPGEFSTRTAEIRSMLLSDGSNVELGPRSGIDLDPGNRRFVTLVAGQAWFGINPSPAPFRIAFGAQQLELEQGEIDVDIRSGSAVAALGAHPARLSGAGHHVLNPDSIYRLVPGEAPSLLPRRAADAFAWRRGKLVAEEIPLGEIIATLNDWHSGWIRLSDADLARLPVTAVLDLRRPEAALRSLEQGLPLRTRSLGGVILSVERA